MNVIDVYDEGIDAIDVYNLSHGPLLEADTCRGWTKTKNDQNYYLATTTPAHDKKILLHRFVFKILVETKKKKILLFVGLIIQSLELR
jgi:hypothetical protein